jgi:uncharacterized membrane protein YhhN
MSALSSIAAPMTTPRWLMPALCAAAAGAMVGATFATAAGVDGWRCLHWFCKPLATLLILAMVWRVRAPVSPLYRQRILAGIAFSLAGDVLLMLSPRWFVAGLVGFLIAHGWFVAAFVSDKPLFEKPLPWLLCLIYGAAAVWLLWPALEPMLRYAVPLYIAVLATMAGQAVGRARWWQARRDPHARAAVFAAIGALVFMLSDSLLAWNRFMVPLPYAAVAVLGTYYVALWLIARSVDARPASTATAATRGETAR